MLSRSLTGCLLVLWAASCSAQRDVAAARGAVDEFHGRLGRQQYAEIFTQAAPDFRKSMSAEASAALFAGIAKRMGAPVSSRLARVQVNHMPGGTFVAVESETKFEAGVVQEKFVWRAGEGGLRLYAYRASSPALEP